MKENETLKINPLPSKTWYWLHLNDTTVKWNGDVQPCMVMAEEPEQVSEAGLNIKEMTTGVGAEADAIFEDENLPILQFTAKAEAGDRVIRLDISSEDKENAAGTVYIAAEENARVTVIEKFTSGKKAQSDLAFRTKLYAGKNSTIRLIQQSLMFFRCLSAEVMYITAFRQNWKATSLNYIRRLAILARSSRHWI